MKIISTFIITAAVALRSFGQTDTLGAAALLGNAIERVETSDIASFTADNLGNIYILTTKGLLKKYGNKGDSLNVFNEVRRYGNVYAMDVTNPLKVILYYRDFSTVVMLDRFLNRINTVDLRKAGVFQAKALALSYDNNLWVFDEQSAKLKKIGDDGRLIMETTDLRQALTRLPSPQKIIDRDGFVYLCDEDNGIYIFDYYGTLKNELALTGIRDIQVINKTILGRKNGSFVRYRLGTLDLMQAHLPPQIKLSYNICIMQQGIYVQDGAGVILYPYKQ
ncbi:MAG: hypothetical protein J0H29_15170 [Sphingobacteriales bacterium]|mgnify:CR=1 FL=1|nr:hypothetical protein [Sphingobacteriales bacterium]OJY87389.1 MAG: hypothetical protein BGP14_08575 [Sphingobacteriales bacterium 44-15]